MKRNHGIWIAIGVILIAGICFTGFTRQFVSRENETLPETVLAESSIEEPSAASAASPESRQLTPGEESAATLEITPLGPSSAAADVEAAGVVLGRYEQRLAEIDAQIVQYRAKNQGTTANAMKVNAEYELRLWETELDVIVDTVSDELPPESSETFMNEQKVWLRDREVQAMDASRRHEGSALESVEYTVSLAEQTRSRVYSLAREYQQILEAE